MNPSFCFTKVSDIHIININKLMFYFISVADISVAEIRSVADIASSNVLLYLYFICDLICFIMIQVLMII